MNETNKVNIEILKQVMTLLYETHVESSEIAAQRGIAIQAVQKMLNSFEEGPDMISEIERVPFSVRRRASEIWNDDKNDKE